MIRYTYIKQLSRHSSGYLSNHEKSNQDFTLHSRTTPKTQSTHLQSVVKEGSFRPHSRSSNQFGGVPNLGCEFRVPFRLTIRVNRSGTCNFTEFDRNSGFVTMDSGVFYTVKSMVILVSYHEARD